MVLHVRIVHKWTLSKNGHAEICIDIQYRSTRIYEYLYISISTQVGRWIENEGSTSSELVAEDSVHVQNKLIFLKKKFCSILQYFGIKRPKDGSHADMWF